MASDLEDFADALLIEGRVYNDHDRDLFRARTGTASSGDLTELSSDVSGIQTQLTETSDKLEVVSGDLDALETTVSGIVVGVTYTVPNKADLPATVNGTAKALFGVVYKDSISSDNNGTYYQDPGVSVWVKVPGDLTIRVINLENFKNYAEDVIPTIESHAGKINVWLDASRRILMENRTDGKTFLRLSDDAIPLIDYINLSPGIRAILPTGADYPGIAVTFNDPSGRSFMYFRTDGKTFFRPADNTITTSAIIDGSITYSKLDPSMRSVFPAKADYAGIALAWVDPNNRYYMYCRTDGKTVLRLADGIVTTSMLADGSVTGVKLADGSITGVKFASGSINRPKLETQLNRDTSNNLEMVMTDAVRTSPPPSIGVKTQQSWAPLPERITPTIFGINNSGTTLEFRRSNGLLIKGNRRFGTFDPSIAPSKVYKGRITDTSTWPPTGTFVAGDYYEYTSLLVRTISGSLPKRGDLMVWDGSAWVFSPAPGGSGAIRYEWDWFEITASGYWNGIAFYPGERLVCLGEELLGNIFHTRWRKGMPSWGEFFRMGEFNPSVGPTFSVNDGDLYEASAAGTFDGKTFAIGDSLIRWGGVWGNIPEGTIRSFANGAVVQLMCYRSSFEWVVRRADKSLTQVGISLSTYGNRKQVLPGKTIVGIGDSMTAFINDMIPLMPDRIIVDRTHASSQPKHVRTVAEYLIYTGDPDVSSTIISCQGQNRIIDLPTIQETAEALVRLCGTTSQRILHVIPLGDFASNITHNGSRFVMPNFEDQVQPLLETSNNNYARAYRYFRDSHPGNWISFRDTLAAAVAGSAIANDANLQFPLGPIGSGFMTNLQVVNTYGIIPFVWMFGVTGMDGFNPNAAVYRGLWTVPGLPTGGSPNDCYLRYESGTEVGRADPIINKDGVWTEVTYSYIHIGSVASVAMATGTANALIARNW